MISTKKHHKHPPLAKPAIGGWGRNEVAFLGAPCGVIKALTDAITAELTPIWKTCYVDADHNEADSDTHTFSGSGLFTDKIQSRRIDFLDEPSQFQRRALLNSFDVILVNGNHFTADAQIVLLDSKKLESLQRKTDRLTNVVAIIESDVSIASCDFLTPYLTPETQVFRSDATQEFHKWFKARIGLPEIRGLVLAGGKSVRMGSDKSEIEYHGMSQREYVMKLLQDIGLNVFLSCRSDQIEQMQGAGELIPDRFFDLGPFGAILSAMMTAPDCAWLVVATDLPLITESTLQQLINQRDTSKIATAYHNPETNFPEPLITLWEPKAYAVLLSYLAQGIACPRKTLINSDVHLIEAQDPGWLRNVNTPEEAKEARDAILSHRV
jgi:molybdopterin-guanine dinucleotide biosynthesis protein A